MPGIPLDQRELGCLRGKEAGPTLILVAGIHGNEPAGVAGIRRVLDALTRRKRRLCGEVLALAGHVRALRAGERFEARDLNRVWTPPLVEALRAKAAAGEALDAEEHEQLELLTVIEAAIARARGPVVLADLHTTSAQGIPFAIFGDTPAQRAFVQAVPIPNILGLEAMVPGVLTHYWAQRGLVTFAVEGGQHDDPAAVDNHAAVTWLALDRAGLFQGRRPAEVGHAHRRLTACRGDLPQVLEVLERRSITPEDDFVMEPGFRNLDYARAGQLLARDRRGEIRAPTEGIVLLPLYQKLGSDGFYWGRTV